MAPVEDWSPRRIRRRTEGCHKWLDEGKARGYAAKDGVRIVGCRPALQLDEDDNEASHGKAPGEQHEDSVPLKKIINIIFHFNKNKT